MLRGISAADPDPSSSRVGHALLERRGRFARLAATLVLDFFGCSAADMLLSESPPLDNDANTPPFTNHHVAMNRGPTEHRGLKLAL